MTTKSGGKRGGRKAGSWQEGLSGEGLRAWRDQNKIARVALARLLNVSATSVQNWESGASIPIKRTQVAMVALMSKPAARALMGANAHANVQAGGISAAAITATGEIVAAMIAAKRKETVDLVTLITNVRASLAS